MEKNKPEIDGKLFRAPLKIQISVLQYPLLRIN